MLNAYRAWLGNVLSVLFESAVSVCGLSLWKSFLAVAKALPIGIGDFGWYDEEIR